MDYFIDLEFAECQAEKNLQKSYFFTNKKSPFDVKAIGSPFSSTKVYLISQIGRRNKITDFHLSLA